MLPYIIYFNMNHAIHNNVNTTYYAINKIMMQLHPEAEETQSE